MTRLAPATASSRQIERRPSQVDPAALAVAVATAYLEVRAGRRAPDQLDPLLSPAAQRRLSVLARRRRRRPRQPSGGFSIRRITSTRIHEDALELVAIVREADTVTAVAVRTDRVRGRWQVTDVGTPEDRQPLVPPGAPIPPPAVPTPTEG